jgi:hypothetical protein
LRTAAERGEDISAVLRRALERYVSEPPEGDDRAVPSG